MRQNAPPISWAASPTPAGSGLPQRSLIVDNHSIHRCAQVRLPPPPPPLLLPPPPPPRCAASPKLAKSLKKAQPVNVTLSQCMCRCVCHFHPNSRDGSGKSKSVVECFYQKAVMFSRKRPLGGQVFCRYFWDCLSHTAKRWVGRVCVWFFRRRLSVVCVCV